MHYHKYSLTEVDMLMPWEREVYITLLTQALEEEKQERERQKQQQ